MARIQYLLAFGSFLFSFIKVAKRKNYSKICDGYVHLLNPAWEGTVESHWVELYKQGEGTCK